MRILITGARGFLGERIMQVLPNAIPGISLRGKSESDILFYIEETHPDAIVHTAAISDTGVCEKAPEDSYTANVLLPVFLSHAAKRTGAKLVCLSSDQVYNGSDADTAYSEGVSLCPTNVYGRHKLEMENRVLDNLPGAVMLRATWLYDLPVYGGICRDTFLTNVIKAALSGQPIYASRCQYRGLTYAREAAQYIEGTLSLPGGVYNFGSENSFNMYDTARQLLSVLHASPSLVCDAPARPNLWMNGEKLRFAGISFSSTLQGLTNCLKDYSLI